MAGEGPCGPEGGYTAYPRLPDVLQFLAGLEANRAAGRDAHFLAGPRVAADAALARLHLKDAKATQLNTFAALHRVTHGFEHSIDGQLGFDLGDIGHARDFVDDIDLDHCVRSAFIGLNSLNQGTYAVKRISALYGCIYRHCCAAPTP